MPHWDQWLIVIPARLYSTRLPNKPLADLAGKPLIVRVYEKIQELAAKGARVEVATDHMEVMTLCKKHQIPVSMTSDKHQSGTDRCQEVASRYELPFIMNVQGDEPFVDLEDLARLAECMESKSHKTMGTLVNRNVSSTDFQNPNVVKAIRSKDGHALYFSRAPIPFVRDKATITGNVEFWHHQGIYAFTKESLQNFCQISPSPLEKLEALEQLRALENGITIYLVEANNPAIGIDTQEDLRRACARYK